MIVSLWYRIHFGQVIGLCSLGYLLETTFTLLLKRERRKTSCWIILAFKLKAYLSCGLFGLHIIQRGLCWDYEITSFHKKKSISVNCICYCNREESVSCGPPGCLNHRMLGATVTHQNFSSELLCVSLHGQTERRNSRICLWGKL